MTISMFAVERAVEIERNLKFSHDVRHPVVAYD